MSKKRCCNINNINVKLFLDNELLIDKNYPVKESNNILSYKDENITTLIDLDKKVLSREGEDYLFVLDIINRMISYTLKENNHTFYMNDIVCSIDNKKEIIIEYDVDGNRKLKIKYI